MAIKQKHDIILIGAGGHCKSCIDVILDVGIYNISALVDRPACLGQEISGFKVEFTDSELPDLIAKYENALICLGQIKTPDQRIKLYESALSLNASFPVHISPQAYVSPRALVEGGTIIMHQVLLNSGSVVGANCIINSKALLEHDVCVGAHCHISTGVLLNGEVVVEDGCFIGSGAIVGQQVTIGKHSVIGAGAVVLKDVPAKSRVLGLWT